LAEFAAEINAALVVALGLSGNDTSSDIVEAVARKFEVP
jgi:hypothetical protein